MGNSENVTSKPFQRHFQISTRAHSASHSSWGVCSLSVSSIRLYKYQSRTFLSSASKLNNVKYTLHTYIHSCQIRKCSLVELSCFSILLSYSLYQFFKRNSYNNNLLLVHFFVVAYFYQLATLTVAYKKRSIQKTNGVVIASSHYFRMVFTKT